jgi:dihydrolipoamide dehydrogenase
MIGARCADLIAEAVVSMEFKPQLKTYQECHTRILLLQKVKEAALAATDNRAIHV